MTQLQCYTALLRGIVLLAAWTGGILAIGSFALLTYYIFPRLKK